MSAFGKRGGVGGGSRPNFGVAKPMKGGPGGAPVQPSSPPAGGDQFPPIDELTPQIDSTSSDPASMGAMDRLTARQNGSGDQASSKSEGFEASVQIGRASCRERV